MLLSNKWETERLNNVLSVIQLVYGPAEFQTEDSLITKPVMPSTTHLLASPMPKNGPTNPSTLGGFYYYFKDQEMKITFTSPWLQSQFEEETQNPDLKPLVSNLSTSASCSSTPGLWPF